MLSEYRYPYANRLRKNPPLPVPAAIRCFVQVGFIKGNERGEDYPQNARYNEGIDGYGERIKLCGPRSRVTNPPH